MQILFIQVTQQSDCPTSYGLPCAPYSESENRASLLENRSIKAPRNFSSVLYSVLPNLLIAHCEHIKRIPRQFQPVSYLFSRPELQVICRFSRLCQSKLFIQNETFYFRNIDLLFGLCLGRQRFVLVRLVCQGKQLTINSKNQLL